MQGVNLVASHLGFSDGLGKLLSSLTQGKFNGPQVVYLRFKFLDAITLILNFPGCQKCFRLRPGESIRETPDCESAVRWDEQSGYR